MAAVVCFVVLLVAHTGRAERGSTWLVPDAKRAAAAHALAQARGARTLAAARSEYARSRFEACARRLLRLEQGLRWHLRRPVDLELVKRVNLWLGLCQAVGGAPQRADQAFARAARLPGASPDPSLFPPAVMQRYQQAQSASGATTCRLEVDGAQTVEIDGRRAEPGSEVAVGEHYVIWDDSSNRLHVGPQCQLELAAVRADLRLDAAEAGDAGFLQQVGRTAGMSRLTLASAGEAGVTLSGFDVERGRFLQRDQPLASVVQDPTRPAADAAPAARPWYRRWWIWALVGAGVAAAVVVPVVLTQTGSTRHDVVF